MATLHDQKRCTAGKHFYNPAQFTACPYCSMASGGLPIGDTVIVPRKGDTVIEDGNNVPRPASKGKTITIYDSFPSTPATGWLVCISGKNLGKDYPIRVNRNRIGRGADNDIVIDDPGVSSSHFTIVFDPISNETVCRVDSDSGLYYINTERVDSTRILKEGDIIALGSTQLIFVPFSGKYYNWEVPNK